MSQESKYSKQETSHCQKNMHVTWPFIMKQKKIVVSESRDITLWTFIHKSNVICKVWGWTSWKPLLELCKGSRLTKWKLIILFRGLNSNEDIRSAWREKKCRTPINSMCSSCYFIHALTWVSSFERILWYEFLKYTCILLNNRFIGYAYCDMHT